MSKPEKLYRKVEYPSGAVRYRETCHIFNGEPKTGIWTIRKKHQKWITELHEMPKAKNIAEIDHYREAIENALSEHLITAKKGLVVHDIANVILETIANKQLDDNEFIEAWKYLTFLGEDEKKGWPIDNLFIDVIKTNDEITIFFETGEYIEHDDGTLEPTDNSDYNVSGRTFEEAIIKLADKIKRKNV